MQVLACSMEDILQPMEGKDAPETSDLSALQTASRAFTLDISKRKLVVICYTLEI